MTLISSFRDCVDWICWAGVAWETEHQWEDWSKSLLLRGKLWVEQKDFRIVSLEVSGKDSQEKPESTGYHLERLSRMRRVLKCDRLKYLNVLPLVVFSPTYFQCPVPSLAHSRCLVNNALFNLSESSQNPFPLSSLNYQCTVENIFGCNLLHEV